MSKFNVKWTGAEISTLRDLFPCGEWPSILAALPRHTRAAISQQARGIGLTRRINKRARYTGAEISALWRLYPNADAADVRAALPGRGNFATIGKKANALGIKRQSQGIRTNKRFVHPMIRQLLNERESREISRPELAKKCGYHVNQILAWELGKVTPDFRSIRDWAEALGFEFVLRKRITMGDVIQYPDRKRLMAGK